MLTFWMLYYLTKGVILGSPAIYLLIKRSLLGKEKILFLITSFSLVILFGTDPIEGRYQIEAIVSNLLGSVLALVVTFILLRTDSIRLHSSLMIATALVFLITGIYCSKISSYWISYGLILSSTSITFVTLTYLLYTRFRVK